jgi:hypothetical protein
MIVAAQASTIPGFASLRLIMSSSAALSNILLLFVHGHTAFIRIISSQRLRTISRGGKGEASTGWKWFRYCGCRASDTEVITIARVDASRMTSSTK